jgi:hypothetical protein
MLHCGYQIKGHKGDLEMQNTGRARKAGTIGIASTALWVLSVIMQYSLGLFEPDGSPLWIVHQALALTALAGIVVGFLGLIWGGAVQSRFGKTSVYLYALSWTLIIFAGVAGILLQGQESPVFLLYPIGGVLGDVSALLTGIAVLVARRWSGWQRFMPLVNFLLVFFGVNLPSFLGVTDGPGLIGELVMGACWFGVSLAVYTTQTRTVSTPASTVVG